MNTHPPLLSLLSRDITVVIWEQVKKKKVPSTFSLFPKGLSVL